MRFKPKLLWSTFGNLSVVPHMHTLLSLGGRGLLNFGNLHQINRSILRIASILQHTPSTRRSARGFAHNGSNSKFRPITPTFRDPLRTMWPAVDVNQFHPDREQPEFADVRSIWAHKGYHGVTVEEVCNLWGRKKWRGGGDPTFEKDVAALHIISRVMKTGWVSSPADSLVANEDFKRLLEDLRCHIESRGTLADVSIGIISKLLVTLVLGMGRNLHNIHSTETETAMLSLTTPLLLTIDGALDERDVDRIVREGHEDHLGSLALALSQAQDPHKVIHPNINLPGLNRAWKRFRVHARTTEFAKALYEKCKYTNSFKSSITIAHALAGTGIDSTFRNPRGHFYNPSNARYAKVRWGRAG